MNQDVEDLLRRLDNESPAAWVTDADNNGAIPLRKLIREAAKALRSQHEACRAAEHRESQWMAAQKQDFQALQKQLAKCEEDRKQMMDAYIKLSEAVHIASAGYGLQEGMTLPDRLKELRAAFDQTTTRAIKAELLVIDLKRKMTLLKKQLGGPVITEEELEEMDAQAVTPEQMAERVKGAKKSLEEIMTRAGPLPTSVLASPTPPVSPESVVTITDPNTVRAIQFIRRASNWYIKMFLDTLTQRDDITGAVRLLIKGLRN